MTYMLWQITDIKAPLSENVQKALAHHERKYGRVPNIVEHSDKVTMVSMDGISFRPIHVPANILLLAVE